MNKIVSIFLKWNWTVTQRNRHKNVPDNKNYTCKLQMKDSLFVYCYVIPNVSNPILIICENVILNNILATHFSKIIVKDVNSDMTNHK